MFLALMFILVPILLLIVSAIIALIKLKIEEIEAEERTQMLAELKQAELSKLLEGWGF